MLSKSSKNAIRAVLFLSLKSNEHKKYSPTQIGKALNLPVPFLAKLLQELSGRNLIVSVKGRNGGFYLSEENKQHSLISIVDSIDGLSKFQECLMGLEKCSNESPCPIHQTITPLRNKIVEELSFKTINEVSEQILDGKLYII